MKAPDWEKQQYARQRLKMVEDQLVNRKIKDLRVLEAMSRVPRHLFVSSALQHNAYGDFPLPIGANQTISQPYMVGLMTEALKISDRQKILEIGTGSGYQTAILAELAEQVFTIERIRSIGLTAQACLQRLDYANIVFKIFDGAYGWKDQAPYDAILVAAAAPEVPKPLVEQLKDKGRLVVPIGEDPEKQSLVVLTKNGSQTSMRSIAECKFVPLIGKYGWPETEKR